MFLKSFLVWQVGIISQNDPSLTYTLPSDTEQISSKGISPSGALSESCSNTGIIGVINLINQN